MIISEGAIGGVTLAPSAGFLEITHILPENVKKYTQHYDPGCRLGFKDLFKWNVRNLYQLFQSGPVSDAPPPYLVSTGDRKHT
ncbi:hypothetical protein CC2G_003270 [Coprinopsis cinerea AmutBmut pab1-1]|nr:hypothetical protein CC2G_003270 [Coprinopsis cinerea AmutBmut pab1-1]